MNKIFFEGKQIEGVQELREDGAGVVFQREDGSAYVSTGLQGNFSI